MILNVTSISLSAETVTYESMVAPVKTYEVKIHGKMTVARHKLLFVLVFTLL